MRADWDTKPEVFGKVRKCERCGKEFIPAALHQYVDYTISNPKGGHPRKLYFCTYTCYIHRKQKERTYFYGWKKVLMYDSEGDLIEEFDNAQKAALWLVSQGYYADNRMIQRCCRGDVASYLGFKFKYKGGDKT